MESLYEKARTSQVASFQGGKRHCKRILWQEELLEANWQSFRKHAECHLISRGIDFNTNEDFKWTLSYKSFFKLRSKDLALQEESGTYLMVV